VSCQKEELSVAALHYRDLIAWQKAMDLVLEVYRATKAFPSDELYGLTNQIRRASVSIPSNIAEGQGRGVGKEFSHHLRIANGSRQEVETQLLIAQRLNYLPADTVQLLLAGAEEVGRLLNGLLRSVTGN
jgi:four helix bundle protein